MTKRRRRKTRSLNDVSIGPRTARIQAVRDGIKGVYRALDRGACKDALFLFKLTNKELKKVSIGSLEKSNMAELKYMLNRSCKTGLGSMTDQQWWDAVLAKTKHRKK